MIVRMCFFLGVILLILFSISCLNSTSEYIGIYTCTSGSRDHHVGDVIEIQNHGMVFAYSTPGESGMAGDWRIEAGNITITYDFFGLTAKGTISGDTMTLEDGSVWKKEPTV
jgi:hypothetical protein